MNVVDYMLLDCFQNVNGERSAQGIIHILSGKKTAQSLADAQLFGIGKYYAVLSSLKKNELEEKTAVLFAESLIEELSNGVFIVTKKGEKIVGYNHYPFLRHLSGLAHWNIEHHFWLSLSLYIQSISNMLAHNSRFLPVVTDYQAVRSVKALFPKTEAERKESAVRLYHEMVQLLENYGNSQIASLFLQRATRFERIGSTFEQLSHDFGTSEEEVRMMFRSLLHFILTKVKEHPHEYEELHRFIPPGHSESLTNSARATLSLLQEGYPLDEIERLRKLKRSTLEDHLVEIARSVKGFDISPFISSEELRLVKEISRTLKDRKLKGIRDQAETLSYLKIRLAIAKEGWG
ncbi:helix-turn-helix domain-containing protein [Fictibacillus iocasae]|uniref:Helix-turn-helix domain-containing protein n=1 Tax=Fictibacillus iocasae TaxID=2715437 RepID=A0ABW2NKK7_9BACL